MELSARGGVDSGENPQQCGLAGTVGADQTETIAILDVEGHIIQGAHVDAVHCVTRQIALRRGSNQHFLQRLATALVHRKFDRQIAQTKERHA